MNRLTYKQFCFALLSACILFIGLSSKTQAKKIHAGMYGVWALNSWNEGAQMLKDNNFQIVVGMANKALLDKAQQKGLQFIVAFGLTKSIAEDETKWQDFLNKLRKNVTELKDHPAVFAWYPVDEPDWQKISPAKIDEVTSVIRSIDKNKPIFTVLGVPSKWQEYLPYFDIIAVEPYLTPGTTTEKVKQWLVKVNDDLGKLKLKKPVWVVLGAFEQIPLGPMDKQPFFKPTPEDFNKMLTIALNEGVSGVLIYSLAFPKSEKYRDWNIVRDDPLLWDEVRKVPGKVNK